MKVLLIGPYPPPFGGVSVHIYNLKRGLEEKGHLVSVFANNPLSEKVEAVQYVKKGLLWSILKAPKLDFDIIHFHTTIYSFRGILGMGWLRGIGKPAVVTLHSFRWDALKPHFLARHVIKLALSIYPQIICVGPEVSQQVVEIGVDPSKVKVISPYIMPVGQEKTEVDLPQITESFLNTHEPVISACASRIAFYRGEDIYGLDMCVVLVRSLVEKFPNMGFVFALAKNDNESYVMEIMRRIEQQGLSKHFIIQTGLEYTSIIKRSSLVIRPTNTDSFGISVVEALTLGVPVVASDVCTRPANTILFASRDQEDLNAKVMSVLCGQQSKGTAPVNLDAQTTIDKIINLYQEVVSKRIL